MSEEIEGQGSGDDGPMDPPRAEGPTGKAQAFAEPVHERTVGEEFEDYEAIAASADMITVTAEGVYRYVSNASARLFGWEPHELLGHAQEEFTHPDDAQL